MAGQHQVAAQACGRVQARQPGCDRQRLELGIERGLGRRRRAAAHAIAHRSSAAPRRALRCGRVRRSRPGRGPARRIAVAGAGRAHAAMPRRWPRCRGRALRPPGPGRASGPAARRCVRRRSAIGPAHAASNWLPLAPPPSHGSVHAGGRSGLCRSSVRRCSARLPSSRSCSVSTAQASMPACSTSSCAVSAAWASGPACTLACMRAARNGPTCSAVARRSPLTRERGPAALRLQLSDELAAKRVARGGAVGGAQRGADRVQAQQRPQRGQRRCVDIDAPAVVVGARCHAALQRGVIGRRMQIGVHAPAGIAPVELRRCRCSGMPATRLSRRSNFGLAAPGQPLRGGVIDRRGGGARTQVGLPACRPSGSGRGARPLRVPRCPARETTAPDRSRPAHRGCAVPRRRRRCAAPPARPGRAHRRCGPGHRATRRARPHRCARRRPAR